MGCMPLCQLARAEELLLYWHRVSALASVSVTKEQVNTTSSMLLRRSVFVLMHTINATPLRQSVRVLTLNFFFNEINKVSCYVLIKELLLHTTN